MTCLPEPSEETTAAVKISAKRAADLVVEARAERDAQRARAIRDLIADLEENGLPEYISLSASDFSEKLDRRQAQDGVFHIFNAKLLTHLLPSFFDVCQAPLQQDPPRSYAAV